MNRYVALLRGIDVGRAKRLAMADLRVLLESLAYRNVRTLLNSGNGRSSCTQSVRGNPMHPRALDCLSRSQAPVGQAKCCNTASRPLHTVRSAAVARRA